MNTRTNPNLLDNGYTTLLLRNSGECLGTDSCSPVRHIRRCKSTVFPGATLVFDADSQRNGISLSGMQAPVGSLLSDQNVVLSLQAMSLPGQTHLFQTSTDLTFTSESTVQTFIGTTGPLIFSENDPVPDFSGKRFHRIGFSAN